jgi:hypothetical protein
VRGRYRRRPPLADLVLALRSELAGCGFALDNRPYRPHATLARKAPALEAYTLDPPIRWPVDSFVLAYGQEGPPPRYRILRRWSLDGSCCNQAFGAMTAPILYAILDPLSLGGATRPPSDGNPIARS